ncbi:enoyl-CoA hydratase [Methylosinus sporium]|uniref:Enoyl-CoA hydratase n=1 Tax=Methylosinus sporium TaxID=428 RepID=A0A549T0N8_METSR|nr:MULTISPECIES: enoyl-CoA hydratase-related protein [Methylosinus]MBU3886764.1 enoyl-CoA hydratase [Methylosinus sp. KRF6]TRL35435.1 enoyl-CoA hydratase [Methylosinus sporium]
MTAVSIAPHGNVVVISIDRRERRNAIDIDVVRGLQEAFAQFDASDGRVAVLTGVGDDFSVGSDPNVLVTELWRCMPTIGIVTKKPIVTAVAGECRGSAFTLNMFADLCVADESANFCYPEGTHGAWGGLAAGLAARIPHKIAMEILLLSQPISARRAYEAGLVNRLAPRGKHLEAALEIARVVATRAPLVMQSMKHFVTDHVLVQSPSEILGRTTRDLTAVRTSQDSAEGKRAMAEGRAPEFVGR